MADVFISYSQVDRDRVQPIASLLESRGYSVFWDPRLRAGQTFRDVLKEQLGEARCIVVVWSAASVSSQWVIWEAEHGRRRQALVPVMLEKMDPLDLPAEFAGIQTVDLSGGGKTETSAGLDELAADIEAILGPPAAAPAAAAQPVSEPEPEPEPELPPESGREPEPATRQEPAPEHPGPQAPARSLPGSRVGRLAAAGVAVAVIGAVISFAVMQRTELPVPQPQKPPVTGTALSPMPTSTPTPAPRESTWEVTPSRKYVEIEADYRRMFLASSLDPARRETVEKVASKIAEGRPRYEKVVQGTAVPWHMVGIIHALEAGLNFSTHLHNGDPLTGRTVRIPPGRPESGSPPFTWEESARDVVLFNKWDEEIDWSFPRQLYHLERYNGLAYRLRSLPSPYLWAATDVYARGRYVADGHFDPDAVSKLPGAAAVMKALIKAGQIDLR